MFWEIIWKAIFKSAELKDKNLVVYFLLLDIWFCAIPAVQNWSLVCVLSWEKNSALLKALSLAVVDNFSSDTDRGLLHILGLFLRYC